MRLRELLETTSEKTVAKTWDEMTPKEKSSGVKGRTVWNEKTRKYRTVFDVPAKLDVEQGVAEAEGDAKGVPHLTKELLKHIVDQIGTEGAHAIVKSIEWGDGAAKELLQLIKHDLENHIELEESVKQRLDKSCWAGYKKQGTKMKGGVRVNNCVPESLESQ